jgi:phosphoglycolate phosphatase/pyrophosphatase PpaX
MRYPCLIIDHDDTAVDSTRRVHHPAHVRTMELLRPHQQAVDLDTWFAKNFDPGIMPYLVDELGMAEDELAVEFRVWREFTARLVPQFYPGFIHALAAYQEQGGAIVVASHSEEHVIRSHYQAAGDGRPVVPDLVFGWELGPEKRKPEPFPVLETLRQLQLDRSDVLVVDDLKPGVDMACAAGVDVAAACWSHDIPAIREFMQRTCVATFATVDEFGAFILR